MLFRTIREAINEPAVQVALYRRAKVKGKRRYVDVIDAPALEMGLLFSPTD
jgi:hypothetical protein